MPRYIENLLSIAITFAVVIVPAFAGGIYLPHRYYAYSPLTIRPYSSSRLRSRRSKTNSSPEGITTTFLVSRKQRKKNSSRLEEPKEKTINPDSDLSELSYNDLGLIGKAVAGCTEIVFATAFEYCTGFLQGLFFGTLVGAPGFVFRPMEKGVRQVFKIEMASRFARMNTRSISWAKNFGSISAAFGGVSAFVWICVTSSMLFFFTMLSYSIDVCCSSVLLQKY